MPATCLMKLRLTPAVVAEMEETIRDAVAGKNNDPTNATYLKIHQVLQQSKSDKRGVVVEMGAQGVAELKSRAEFNVGINGVCQENLGWSTDPADKGYWLGRMRAYKALLAQINAITELAPTAVNAKKLGG